MDSTEIGLSIITCHPSSEEVPILRHSVECNLGLEQTEIVAIIEGDSIAKKYNAGAARARGKILLFIHSDVEIWSARAIFAGAIQLLGTNPNIGIIGIAGSRVIREDGVWWTAQRDQLSGACMHTEPGPNGPEMWMTAFGRYGRVAVLDGVFLMMRHDLFDQLTGFDESFPGYDFDDVDMTLRSHLAGFLNLTFPLQVLHHSIGDVRNKPQWHLNCTQFVEKWKDILPVALPA